MGRRRLEQVDLETGEVVQGFVAVLQPRRQNGFGKEWFAMSQPALEVISKEVKSLDDYRVLMQLLVQLDFDNLIQVPQSEIAKKLEMYPSHVNRSIKRLIGLGAIIEGPRIGRSRSYRLNPHFGWKGSARSHNQALKDRMETAGISSVIEGGKEESDPERDPDTIDWIEEGEKV